jgi:hypothetical protein
MTNPEPSRFDHDQQVAERRRVGARHGGEIVKAEFASALTRRRYCEIVGIHETTLRRWEKTGLVKPTVQTILNSPTMIFAAEEVSFGKRLVELLRRRAGTISLVEAAEIVRQQRL